MKKITMYTALVWFILPKEIAEVYLEKFLKEKEKKEKDLKNRIKLNPI